MAREAVTGAHLGQQEREREARERFLRDHQILSSAGVALATLWKSEGKLFALSMEPTDRFPAFQFGDDGTPLPVIADVIQIFDGQSQWALALWFAAPSGWLNGRKPVEMLRADPAAVVNAARHATEPLAV